MLHSKVTSTDFVVQREELQEKGRYKDTEMGRCGWRCSVQTMPHPSVCCVHRCRWLTDLRSREEFAAWSFLSASSQLNKETWLGTFCWQAREQEGKRRRLMLFDRYIPGKLSPFILTSSLRNNACESLIPLYPYSLEHLLLHSASSHFMSLCSFKALVLEKRPVNIRELLCRNQYKTSKLHISEKGVFILKCWKRTLNQEVCSKEFRHRCQSKKSEYHTKHLNFDIAAVPPARATAATTHNTLLWKSCCHWGLAAEIPPRKWMKGFVCSASCAFLMVG